MEIWREFPNKEGEKPSYREKVAFFFSVNYAIRVLIPSEKLTKNSLRFFYVSAEVACF
jgi:hypothetical protein